MKNFLRQCTIYIKTLAFQVLQESSSTIQNSAAAFSDTNQKHVCWKSYKVSKVFGCVAGVGLLQYWVRPFEKICVVK